MTYMHRSDAIVFTPCHFSKVSTSSEHVKAYFNFWPQEETTQTSSIDLKSFSAFYS